MLRCFRNIAGFEDGGGGLGPDEGSWAAVVLGDVAFDASLQIDDGDEDAPLEVAARQRGEEALDGIESGG